MTPINKDESIEMHELQCMKGIAWRDIHGMRCIEWDAWKRYLECEFRMGYVRLDEWFADKLIHKDV